METAAEKESNLNNIENNLKGLGTKMKKASTIPKMAAINRLLVFSVLLLYFSSSILCQPLKDEDEIIHNVRLEREHDIRRRSVAHPIRITTVYLDVSKIANMDIIKQLLSESILYFEDTLRVKHPVKNILLQRRCANGSYFLKDEQGNSQGKVRYCKIACEDKKPSCGPAHVPDKDLDVCRLCDESGNNCKEDGKTNGTGYNNTDFVMYITASNDKCEKPKTVAYAAVCQQEISVDRPVAGFLNICPNKVKNMTEQNHHHELLATLKHEIFHALGFSPSLYAFYRNSTGAPLTERVKYGMPQYSEVSKSYIPSEKVLKRITRKDWEIRSDRGNNGKIDHSVYMIVTPKVRDEAQRHFNCSTLEGAELENQGGLGTEMAHWEKRLFENEGMTGAFTQNSVFSRITLALMEDTGWYEADYRKAEPLRWGQNRGCKFVKNSCKAWMTARNSSHSSLEPFCQRFKSQKQGLHTSCSVDKTSVAMCNLIKYNYAIPLEYQYFESSIFANAERYGGSVDYADYCPYFQAFTWTSQGVAVRGSSCIQPSNEKPKEKNYALEKYSSSGSRCFVQGKPWTKTKCSRQWITVDWGSGCYNYKCEKDGLKVIVEGYKYTCFHKGQVLYIQMQSHDNWVHQGTIVCPACKDVCYDAPVMCPVEVMNPPKGLQPKPILKSYPCTANRFGLSSTLYSILSFFVIFLI